MDNHEKDRSQWLDELLGASNTPDTIGADEHAVHTVGLTHPNDLELERILSEDWLNADKHVEPTTTVPVNNTEASDEDTLRPTIVIPAPIQPEQNVPQNDTVELYDPFDEAAYTPPVENQPQPAFEDDTAFFIPADIPVQQPAPTPEPNVQEQPPQQAPSINPTANIRPKKKEGYGFLGIPHIISTVIWILLIAFVGISLGRALWVCCAEVMAFGKENHQVTITITKEDIEEGGVDAIADKLSNAKLIDYPQLFKFFANATGKSENIVAGTYTLNARLDYNAMINAMSSRTGREVVEIMFPEGYTCAQIFKLLEENEVCTTAEMEEFLETYKPEDGELDDYWFLEGLTWGSKYCLEGYLAPDTYEFYKYDDPERVLTKFLDEFDDRFTDIMKEDFEAIQYSYMDALYKEGYSSQYIQEHRLTVHDVLTIASIVQRETGSSSESFDIASVFYNRLINGMELGSDATVYYAIGDYFSEKGELTASDLNSDSPYNTRKYRGLPPGPICNPGTYALYAALDPNETDYLYFVYDSKAEEHLFSETIEEHEQKCRELGLW